MTLWLDLAQVWDAIDRGNPPGRSNILLGEAGLTLIDWEFAGELPIAFDLAKVHLNCADPVAVQTALERGLDHSVGGRSDHYSFAEQVALSHVHMLSWHDMRKDKARAAGSSDEFRTAVTRRLSSIGQFLEAL